jgi:hypothetical protein
LAIGMAVALGAACAPAGSKVPVAAEAPTVVERQDGPARLPNRVYRAAELEGRWMMGVENGDTYTRSNHLVLQNGAAQQVSEYAAMGSAGPTKESVSAGRYTIHADGSLEVSNLGLRRTFAILETKPGREVLLFGAVRTGEVYREVATDSTYTSIATWRFASPLSDVLAGARCHVAIAVQVLEGTKQVWRESAEFDCSRKPPEYRAAPDVDAWPTLILSELFPPSPSGGRSELGYKSNAPSEKLAKVVAQHIQREFHYNPRFPDFFSIGQRTCAEGPCGWVRER